MATHKFSNYLRRAPRVTIAPSRKIVTTHNVFDCENDYEYLDYINAVTTAIVLEKDRKLKGIEITAYGYLAGHIYRSLDTMVSMFRKGQLVGKIGVRT